MDDPTSKVEAPPWRPNAGYAAFHAPRFDFITTLLRPALGGPGTRVLDIGLSDLTGLLAQRLQTRVDSMGLEPEADLTHGHHYHFDLNSTQRREAWRLDFGPYDVLVFAEVIEHLHTAPELVLSYVRELLVRGGLLIVQTPNAASLRKRLRLLMGQNPYERIRADPSNPGHFREYTTAELHELVTAAGFRVTRLETQFYFDARFAQHDGGDAAASSWTGTLRNAVYRLLPGGLREGITLVAEKE